MRLGEFILARSEAILVDLEAFAGTLLPAAAHLDKWALRDHAKAMLVAIAKDLSADQSASAQLSKSHGLAPKDDGHQPLGCMGSCASATVLISIRWRQSPRFARICSAPLARGSFPAGDDRQDIIRFNEAIDQALAVDQRLQPGT